MMFAPIFSVAAASPAVLALLGTNPVRLYLFGEAPQNVQTPYAVWQTVSGSPENYLGQVPDADSWTTQVDVYAATATSARAVAEALRDTFEPVAYITDWRGESRATPTSNFRVSFDVAWIGARGPIDPSELIIDGGNPSTQFTTMFDGGGP